MCSFGDSVSVCVCVCVCVCNYKSTVGVKHQMETVPAVFIDTSSTSEQRLSTFTRGQALKRCPPPVSEDHDASGPPARWHSSWLPHRHSFTGESCSAALSSKKHLEFCERFNDIIWCWWLNVEINLLYWVLKTSLAAGWFVICRSHFLWIWRSPAAVGKTYFRPIFCFVIC